MENPDPPVGQAPVGQPGQPAPAGPLKPLNPPPPTPADQVPDIVPEDETHFADAVDEYVNAVMT